MKVGDWVLCKKDMLHLFKADKMYQIYNIKKYEVQVIAIFDDEIRRREGPWQVINFLYKATYELDSKKWNHFVDIFHTPNELRKLKLRKLLK